MTGTPTTARLISLDAFRGFAIAGMVLVNNPGDWGNVYSQLGARQVERLDVHRLDLSVLPVHRRRVDGVLARAPGRRRAPTRRALLRQARQARRAHLPDRLCCST